MSIRRMVRRKGRPVFSFIDPGVAEEPFLVDVVHGSWLATLADVALFFQPMTDPEKRSFYLTEPDGRVSYLKMVVGAEAAEAYVERLKAAADEGGFPAVAQRSENARLLRRHPRPEWAPPSS